MFANSGPIILSGFIGRDGAPSLGVLNAASYGAIGDARSVSDGVTTNLSAQISSATANFTQADVGKAIFVALSATVIVAGPTCPTIQSVQSSTMATMSQAADFGGSGITFMVGTDNSAAFAKAFTALFAQSTGVLIISPGSYVCLSPWGVLGSDSISSVYSIQGASFAAQSKGNTSIILSPYTAYSLSGSPNLYRFLTREWAGTLENLFFTDLGLVNINHASFSNLSMFYMVDVPAASKNCSYTITLPAGQNNVAVTAASDTFQSENETVVATGCGGYNCFGGGFFSNLRAAGGDYGLTLVDANDCTFVGGAITSTSGPGLVLNGSPLPVSQNTFTGLVITGGGIGNNCAVYTNLAGGAPQNTFIGCTINAAPSILPTSNRSAIKVLAGNTLIFNSCVIGAFGSGVGITVAGTVVLSSCFFPTGIAWVADIMYYSGGGRSLLLDPNGHLQYCTTGGVSGADIPPSWSESGGTTDDGTAVWTDAGVAAVLESKSGTGAIVDGGGNLGIMIN